MERSQLKLTDEPYVQNWLRHFPDNDRKIISLLLSQLLLVPTSNILRSIDLLLNNERADRIQKQNVAPIVILPIIKTSRRSIFPVPKKYSSKSKHKIKLNSTDKEFPELIQFSKKYRDPGIGSEALIANLITSAFRKWKNEIIINPSIYEMRKQLVRNIYLLDDLVASGDRFIKYYNKLLAHPTIKSWKSSKYLNFTLICYSITEEAFKRIKFFDSNIQILYEIKCPTIDNTASLSKKQKQLIETTCKKYSNRFRNFALGYGNSRALLVFEHGVPNNLPGILFKRINNKIPALFPNQVIPHNLKYCFIDIGSPELMEKFKYYFSLIRKKFITFVDKKSNTDLLFFEILDAISKGYRKNESLSNYMLLDQNIIFEKLSLLRKKEFINENNNLTIIGKNTLKKLKKKKIMESNCDFDKHINYIPKSFGGN